MFPALMLKVPLTHKQITVIIAQQLTIAKNGAPHNTSTESQDGHRMKFLETLKTRILPLFVSLMISLVVLNLCMGISFTSSQQETSQAQQANTYTLQSFLGKAQQFSLTDLAAAELHKVVTRTALHEEVEQVTEQTFISTKPTEFKSASTVCKELPFSKAVNSQEQQRFTTLAEALLLHNIEFHSTNEFKSLAERYSLLGELQYESLLARVEQEFSVYRYRVYAPTYDIANSAFEIGPAPLNDTAQQISPFSLAKSIGAGDEQSRTSNRTTRVVKIYRYKVAGAEQNAPTYMQFSTEIQGNLVDIQDERKFNNFQLKEWFTTDGTRQTQSIEQSAEQTQITEQSQQAQAVEQATEPTLETYEQIKESMRVYRQSNEPTELSLNTSEREIYILYEYEPIENQINLLIMRYTGAGVRASEQQIEFPTNGMILNTDISGTIIGAKYTTELVPSFLESWDSIQGATPLQITEDRSVVLVTEAKTVYLNVIDTDLMLNQ